MKVNVINEAGEIKLYCVFVNDYSAQYNMTTLCMELNKHGNVMDERLRKMTEDKIKISGNHVFF